MKKQLILLIVIIIFLASCQNNEVVCSSNENLTISSLINPPVVKESVVTSVKENSEIQKEEIKNEPVLKELLTKEVFEGDLVSFPNLKAEDPDGDKLTYTFSKPLNETGEWQTKKGDEGKYTITITASDGVNKSFQDVELLIKKKNSAPKLTVEKEVKVKEGETINLNPIASDEDADKVEITYSGWMSSKERKTSFEDAGTYSVKVTASDGKDSTNEDVTIIVENVNRPPVFVSGSFT